MLLGTYALSATCTGYYPHGARSEAGGRARGVSNTVVEVFASASDPPNSAVAYANVFMIPVKVGVIVNVMELVAPALAEGEKATRVSMATGKDGRGEKEFAAKMLRDAPGTFLLECVSLDFPDEDAMPPAARIGPNDDGRLFFTSSTGLEEAQERAKHDLSVVPKWALTGGKREKRERRDTLSGASEGDKPEGDPYTTPVTMLAGYHDVTEDGDRAEEMATSVSRHGDGVVEMQAGDGKDDDPLETKLRALEAAVSLVNTPYPPQEATLDDPTSVQDLSSTSSVSGFSVENDEGGVVLCPSGIYRITLADPQLHFSLATRVGKGGEVVDATDGVPGTVTFHVQSDKRKPYEAKTNRFDFDPTSPMVELIYTDNTAGQFVAHGSGWGQAVPVNVYLCRRTRIDIQVVDGDTGEPVNALGFGYSVSEMQKKKIRGRSKVVEVELYQGITERSLAATSAEEEDTDSSRSAAGRKATGECHAHPDAHTFHSMYADSRGGEYAVRVWSDEASMPDWAPRSSRLVRHVGGLAAAAGGGGDAVFLFEMRRKRSLSLRVCERHEADIGIPGVRVALAVVAPPPPPPPVPPPPPLSTFEANLRGLERRTAARDAVEEWMASLVRALGEHAAETPSEEERTRETEVTTDGEGRAAVMVPPGSRVFSSAANAAATLLRTWAPPSLDVGGDQRTFDVFAARARACAPADAFVDLDDPRDPLAAGDGGPAGPLTMSLQRICPVIVKVTDTNFDPAPGLTVEVTIEAMPETPEDDAVGEAPSLPLRLVTATTDEDGVVGADGLITAPVGAWLMARVVTAPVKYQDIDDLPRGYRGHEERWIVNEDITLAVEVPVDDGEGGTRMELVRPTADELLRKATEIGPLLRYPRKPWARVRAVDAATGETVLGVPCVLSLPARVPESGSAAPGVDVETPKETVLFSGVTGDTAANAVLYPPPQDPGTCVVLLATPAPGGRFQDSAAAASSVASLPLHVTREAPMSGPDDPASALDVTIALRRRVDDDENVSFWLRRDAMSPKFYARGEDGVGVVASRAQSNHLARLAPGARRGEVIAANPAPPRALAAHDGRAAVDATADVAPSGEDDWAALWDIAAVDALKNGVFSRGGYVEPVEQPIPPFDMAEPEKTLRPPLETVSLAVKLKRWGAPLALAGAKVAGCPEERLPTAGVSQPASFYTWDPTEGADPNKQLKLGFHPELPSRLNVQAAAYRATAAALQAQAARVEAWNVGRGRGGRLAFGDGAAAEAVLAVRQRFASRTREEAAASDAPSDSSTERKISLSPRGRFDVGHGGAFVLFAAALTEPELVAIASQVRDLLAFWSTHVAAHDGRDDDAGEADLDDDDDAKMRFTIAYCPAAPGPETVQVFSPHRMHRCRAHDVERAHAWLLERIAADFAAHGAPRADGARGGALVEATEAVCELGGYEGEALYLVASARAEVFPDGTPAGAARLADYVLCALADGLTRAATEAAKREGRPNATFRPEHGWHGLLGVQAHCVVVGHEALPPSTWPDVNFPDGTPAMPEQTSFASAAPAIAAATSGRLQWVDVAGLVKALEQMPTKALRESADTYEGEAVRAAMLHDEYTATIKAALRSRWGKAARAKKVVDGFSWIPDKGLKVAADAIEEAVEVVAVEGADEDKEMDGEKKKKNAKKTKGKKKKDHDWTQEWAGDPKWKGYGSQVYYQPRSWWPPLPREARKLAKKRDKNAASPSRFRPWDGDTAEWVPPWSVLTPPMRDLALINQPPWRHNSPSGDPTIRLDRAPPEHMRGQRRRPLSAAAGGAGFASEKNTRSAGPPRMRTPPPPSSSPPSRTRSTPSQRRPASPSVFENRGTPSEWRVSEGRAIWHGLPTMWEAQCGNGSAPGLGSARVGGATRAMDALCVAPDMDRETPVPSPGTRPTAAEGTGGHITYRGFRRRAVL